MSGGVMVCYYGSWAAYRHGDGKFEVENIDPSLCTHLIYAFAGLNKDNTIMVLDPWKDLSGNGRMGYYDKFTALKRRKPGLKTLLAVGGWEEGSEKYSMMAANASSRRTFVDSAIRLLKAHNFDGLDVDWEYPANRGGSFQDKANFVQLLSDLKVALHANGMILTAAVSGGKETIDSAYDVRGMARHLDLLNVMTYDFHGSWESQTHHHSPLYAHPRDSVDKRHLSQDFAINYWIENGMPANKITLGLPLYGRSWTLSCNETGFYAPTSGPGAGGPYTNTDGSLGYNEICEAIHTQGWTVVRDPAMNEPYAFSRQNRIWCCYEDEASVKTKARYARRLGLAGLMVWGIETDDFLGKYGRKFSLIRSMNEA